MIFFTFSLFLRQVALVNLILTNFLKFPKNLPYLLTRSRRWDTGFPDIPYPIKIPISYKWLKTALHLMPFFKTRANLQSYDTKMEFIRPKLMKIWSFEIWIFFINKIEKIANLTIVKGLTNGEKYGKLH